MFPVCNCGSSVEACGHMNGSEEPNKMIVLPASTEALRSVSPELRSAMQVFLMKVLHWELGQSANEMLNIWSACKRTALFKDVSCLLDHPMLRKGTNRLGYDPFMISFDEYITAEMALTDLLSADSRRMDQLLKGAAGREQQAGLVAAAASNLFLPKSERSLSVAEETSVTLLRNIVDQSSECNFFTTRVLGNLMENNSGAPWHPPEGVLDGASGIGQFEEFVCSCGYRYIIGDCTRPNQVGICPQC